MKHLVLIIMLLCSFGSATAQFTKSIQLKPIYKQGGKYFYGGKKVNSGFSLQIPLEGINNPDVNRYFRNFKTLQTLRGIAYIPSILFLFTSDSGSQQDAITFAYLTLGGIAGDIVFGLISQHKMRQAIDIYNVAIAERATIGLQLERCQTNQTFISLGIHQRF